MIRSAAELPLTLIGGYLGSGKTTLINRLLADKADRRIAVLVNDFGALNIDAALIDAASDRTIALTNGCICCLLGDDLGAALSEVDAARERLDWVLLEASGVADTRRLTAQINAWPGFSFTGGITLVDAQRIRDQAGDKYIGRHILSQLDSADRLLLSFLDECTEEQHVDLRQWLARHSQTEVHTAAALNWEDLADLQPKHRFRHVDSDVDAERSAHDPQSHPALTSVTFRQAQPISRDRFDVWCRQVAQQVQRAKGWLVFSEQPGKPYLLQMVNGRIKLSVAPERASDRGALVVIARDAAHLPDPFLIT